MKRKKEQILEAYEQYQTKRNEWRVELGQLTKELETLPECPKKRGVKEMIQVIQYHLNSAGHANGYNKIDIEYQHNLVVTRKGQALDDALEMIEIRERLYWLYAACPSLDGYKETDSLDKQADEAEAALQEGDHDAFSQTLEKVKAGIKALWASFRATA